MINQTFEDVGFSLKNPFLAQSFGNPFGLTRTIFLSPFLNKMENTKSPPSFVSFIFSILSLKSLSMVCNTFKEAGSVVFSLLPIIFNS